MTVRRPVAVGAVLAMAALGLAQAPSAGAVPAGPARAGLASAALAPAVGPPIAAVNLPVPAVPPGGQGFFSVTGATAGGVLSGSAEVSVLLPDGTLDLRRSAVRWRRDAQGRWVRRTLPLPAGASQPYTAGIDASGAVAGGAVVGGVNRVLVWPATGAPRVVGPAGASSTAVGPDGTVGVAVPVAGGLTGAGLLPPGGALTLLDGGATAVVLSVGGPSLAVTQSTTPGGQATATVSYWNAGAQKVLAALGPVDRVIPCPSRVRTDGALVWTRGVRTAAGVRPFPQRHTGAVPGTETRLGTRGGTGFTGCLGDDTFAADGTAGGASTAPGGATLATVWRGTRPTALPLQAGETDSTVVAVASGGRAVVLAGTAAGDPTLYAWSGAGVRPLTVPAGWQLAELVDYADSGLVVANLEPFGGGELRPVVWQVPA